jgi:tRNA uridine 5-carboxymethylaminomethyl modification enzyme
MTAATHKKYDAIIIGAGHAGIEASLVCARMGLETLLVTGDFKTIGQMPCNPAIGGLAKGHLVREIDALGGEMGKAIDATGIQFRMLNRSKGPAVWAPRAQADKYAYMDYCRKVLNRTPHLTLQEDMVNGLLYETLKEPKSGTSYKHRISGVKGESGNEYYGTNVIATTGTFLNGLIHIGLEHTPAGRIGEKPALGLTESFIALGLEVGRLKTGTPARLDPKSINWDILDTQFGDEPPPPFSHFTKKLELVQEVCHITHTNEKTHQIIMNGLDRSPLYTGVIKGKGPRYCPSIEDKIKRFADKPQHQIFLEPEDRARTSIYPNGISTSLPLDVQVNFIHSIVGLEEAELLRPGYAVEYDFVPPHQCYPTLEIKTVEGLYIAGQICGTSGYEEAAAQGFMAGINAALKLQGKKPFILDRSQAYIGVLIDDLVTMEHHEPYRMFTSMAEYRLLLRQDNADLRLMDYGHEFGLIPDDFYQEFCDYRNSLDTEINRLKRTRIKIPSAHLHNAGEESVSLEQYLKRPEITYSQLAEKDAPSAEIPEKLKEQVTITVKYKGYIDRQVAQATHFKELESKRIPESLDYTKITGLSKESREKLIKIRPVSLGQASRIAGVSPSDLSVLMVYLHHRE